MENEIITSIEEIITNISNKANDLSELAEKEKNKSVKKYEMCRPSKTKAIIVYVLIEKLLFSVKKGRLMI